MASFISFFKTNFQIQYGWLWIWEVDDNRKQLIDLRVGERLVQEVQQTTSKVANAVWGYVSTITGIYQVQPA